MNTFLEDFPDANSQALVRTACENSLKVFIKIMHYYTTGAHFTFKPFHDELIQKLEERAFYKTTKNLLINLPVGFGKSAIVEYFKSWCFARNKNICFLYTSYSDKLIVKLSSEIMELMKSEPFQALWGYEFKKDKKSKANWSIQGSIGRAGLTAGSIGGTITGLDAGNPAVEGFCGALIIDDPMKAGDEIYETKRDLVAEYFDRKLTTRLRRSDVPIILIMQRLHEEDLTGYIKNEGKYASDLTPKQREKWKETWDEVCVRALVDEKSIWEEKVSTETLLRERERTPFVFYPQRQQAPNSNINALFKGIRFIDDETLLHNGWAVLDKSFGGGDSTAFVIGNEFVLDGQKKVVMYGKKWDKHVDECLPMVFGLLDKYLISKRRTYTENNDDKGYTARNNGFVSYHEKMNKYYKIMTYLYANWQDVYFLQGTDEDFIRQIQSYNEEAAHDDCPDAGATLCRLLRDNKIKVATGLQC